MSWQLVFTKQAQKDAKNLSASGLGSKAEALLKILRKDPFQQPPPFEKLVGDLSGAYSRRLDIQHRRCVSDPNGYQNSKGNPNVDSLRMRCS